MQYLNHGKPSTISALPVTLKSFHRAHKRGISVFCKASTKPALKKAYIFVRSVYYNRVSSCFCLCFKVPMYSLFFSFHFMSIKTLHKLPAWDCFLNPTCSLRPLLPGPAFCLHNSSIDFFVHCVLLHLKW